MRKFAAIIVPVVLICLVILSSTWVLTEFGIESLTAFVLAAAMTLTTSAVFLMIQGLASGSRNRRSRRSPAARSAGNSIGNINDYDIVQKGHYRGRRLHHCSDGSVLGETRRGWRQFASFEDFQGYVDRR